MIEITTILKQIVINTSEHYKNEALFIAGKKCSQFPWTRPEAGSGSFWTEKTPYLEL